MTLDDLSQYRAEILWWEICGLLHDIGKLSDTFLKYRRTWNTLPDGYATKDPHDHQWLEKDDLLQKPEFTLLNSFFQNRIAIPTQHTKGELSVVNAVHHHIDNPHGDELVRLLRLGDRADSIYDRNNPLIGNEQTDHANPCGTGDWYRSNVYGHEGARTRIVRGLLDRVREELYTRVQVKLQRLANKPGELANSFDNYTGIRELLRLYFEPAMSDTTRPNNDTSLWEHVYSVATITKALHIQRIWGEPVTDAAFRLLGVGFDRLRYVSYGHKIGDVLGRNGIVDRAFDVMERIVEFDIPLGNCIYRDDCFLVFLVPALRGFDAEWMRPRFIEAAIGASEGEIVPHVIVSEPLKSTTGIVSVLQELKRLIAVPVPDGKPIAARFKSWEDGESVCSVCRLRGSARNAKDNRKVCRVCRKRRQHHTEGLGSRQLAGTPFLSEIADNNGRVALVVTKFGLREWLDGRMVRTNFITEPNGIRKTVEAVRHTRELESGAGEWEQWYKDAPLDSPEAMLRAFLECRDGTEAANKAVAFFGRHIVGTKRGVALNTNATEARRIWDDAKKQAEEEHLFAEPLTGDIHLNVICAKTPTPSTVYDVWETTEEFLKSIAGHRTHFADGPGSMIAQEPALLEMLGRALEPRPRLHFRSVELEQALDADDNSIDVTVNGGACEAVLDKGRFWLIGNRLDGIAGKPCTVRSATLELLIVPEETDEPVYYPYRQISYSPDVLMMLVPADQAPAITEAIHSRYLEEFGKAYGRLPFSIGNIFFPQHLPMFSVLDAAWRMVRNFERLHDGPWLEGELDRDLAKQLPVQLGNCEADYFHPYMRLADTSRAGPSDFKTLVGPVAWIPSLGGRPVLTRPNFYDYVLLGASSDRFDIALGHGSANWRWHDDPDQQPRVDAESLARGCEREGRSHMGPVTMEQFQNLRRLWQNLKIRRISDSSMRNFEHVLMERLERWRALNPEQAEDAVNGLARSLVPRYFGEDDGEEVLKTVQDGTFYRTLDLHMRILKERLSEGANDGSRTNSPATL